jgi:hypothetical protein
LTVILLPASAEEAIGDPPWVQRAKTSSFIPFGKVTIPERETLGKQSTSASDTMIAFFMAFRNSLTLPGHGYALINPIASSEILAILAGISLLSLRRKYSVSKGTSSGRSRNGGMRRASGESPSKAMNGGAGETSPPAFPSSVAGYCGGQALPLFYGLFPDHSSFSVLRETSMTYSGNHFKKLKCYEIFISA